MLRVAWTTSVMIVALLGAGDTINTNCLPRSEVLTGVADRLTQLVEHYRGQEEGLNVDGFYGMRIAQGALAASTDSLSNQRAGQQPLKFKLLRLSDSINELSATTDALLRHEDPEYYNYFKPVIENPFSLNAKPQRLELPADSQYSPILSENLYNETYGDICFTRLMGTYKPQSHSYKCFIGKDCLKMMTEPMHSGYSLTHQLLYLIIAQKVGCESLVNALLSPSSLGHMQKKLCQKILLENDHLMNSGQKTKPRVSSRQTDIFIEQAVLCTMLGFTNFLDIEKMEAVMEHQDRTNGCYAM
ncbi:UPF0764 protein C16orf89 homolog [Watersipora subatra]|uniref:UPF0764 protein C16orf89 homolog n=1 Tax=Watersipora subatra TaxID=2589382 RepID=UPI00355C796E